MHCDIIHYTPTRPQLYFRTKFESVANMTDLCPLPSAQGHQKDRKLKFKMFPNVQVGSHCLGDHCKISPLFSPCIHLWTEVVWLEMAPFRDVLNHPLTDETWPDQTKDKYNGKYEYKTNTRQRHVIQRRKMTITNTITKTILNTNTRQRQQILFE